MALLLIINTPLISGQEGDSIISETQEIEVNPEESILIGEDQEPLSEAQQPVLSTWDFIRMLLILGVVIGVIYLMFYFLKRGSRKRYPENELIRIMDYRELSGNRALHLVEVGSNCYLIGSAENSISLISEIKDKESLDLLRLELSKRPSPQKRTFSDFFPNLLKAGAGKSTMVSETVRFMKEQKDRLKKLR